MKQAKEYELLHQSHSPLLVRVKSNVKLRDHFDAKNFGLADQPSEIEVIFRRHEVTVPRLNNAQPFIHALGEPGRREIYYEHDLISNLSWTKAKLCLKDLDKVPMLLVNSAYYRFVRFQIGTIFSPLAHLAQVIQVKLLQRGYSPIHGAAIYMNGEGILLVAPGNTGKTATVLQAINRGARFLSEDVSIIDGTNVYACPFTGSFLYDPKAIADLIGREGLRRSVVIKLKFIRFILRSALIKNVAWVMRALQPTNFADLDIVPEFVAKVKIGRIFFLTRGKANVKELGKKEALRRALIINRSEFCYYTNELLLAYSYFNPELNIKDLMETEERLLARTIDNCDCFLCTSNSARECVALIKQVLNTH